MIGLLMNSQSTLSQSTERKTATPAPDTTHLDVVAPESQERLSPFEAYRHIRNFRHAEPLTALGTACLFMSQVEPFKSAGFGHWVDTLKGQILRKHYFFSQIEGRIVGYCGWALTSHESAQAWVQGTRELSYQECLDGPCLLVMALHASEPRVSPYQVLAMRTLFADRELTYWKRITPQGVRVLRYNLQATGVRRPKLNIEIAELGRSN